MSVVVLPPSGPPLALRVLWFWCVGWWLGAAVSLLAWLLNLTIVGLPLGLTLLNRLPSIITLKPQGQTWRQEGALVLHGARQRPFLVRAAYFVVVGSWLSLLWLVVAYVLAVTVVGIPLAFWMYDQVPAITTLARD